jgi:hypothetical protein
MKLHNHPMRFFEATNDGGTGGGDFSWATAEGKLSDGYVDHLPEDMKPQAGEIAKLVDKYQGSIPALLKGALGLQSVAGKKFAEPAQDWTPEQLAEYRTARGIPANVDEYDISPDAASLPEGFQFNKDVYKPLAKLAHELNLSPAAMKKVAAQIVQIDKSRQEAAIEMIREQDSKTIEGLKKDFGADYEKRVDRATRAGKVLGIDTSVETNPIANHPVFIRALDRMAAMMGEDKLVTGDGNPSLQPGKLKAKDIQTNPDNPLYKKYQEGDPETVAYVRSLNQNG